MIVTHIPRRQGLDLLIQPPAFPIGLVSDTHGLLRPEVLPLLAGCSAIVHAGDVGNPEVLTALKTVAPVFAVRGNNDQGLWAETLPRRESITRGGVRIMIIHDLSELDVDPGADGYQVVISGHSHRPGVVDRDGILYVNPGSAGPRRFKLPISLGFLNIVDERAQAWIQQIDIR